MACLQVDVTLEPPLLVEVTVGNQITFHTTSDTVEIPQNLPDLVASWLNNGQSNNDN